jgi:hypothetical protein
LQANSQAEASQGGEASIERIQADEIIAELPEAAKL